MTMAGAGAIPMHRAAATNPIDTRFVILFLQRSKAVRNNTLSTAVLPNAPSSGEERRVAQRANSQSANLLIDRMLFVRELLLASLSGRRDKPPFAVFTGAFAVLRTFAVTRRERVKRGISRLLKALPAE
jgi:hypothetical protein